MTTERIHLNNLPDATRDCVCDRIAEHTVALVRSPTQIGTREDQLIGAGTLVYTQGLHCILTAEHVLKVLKPTDRVGFVPSFSGTPSALSYEYNHLDIHLIARGTVDSEGPDLGVIVLSDSQLGFLKATKTFYNLDARVQRFAGKYLSLDQGFWFTCGMLGETQVHQKSEHHSLASLGFHAHCGAAANPDVYPSTSSYDYLEVRVPYESASDSLPESFGGLSGGGLWQVPMKRTSKDTIEAVEYVLSGVIFYQTAIENGVRRLRCHGRRTVYEVTRIYLSARSGA